MNKEEILDSNYQPRMHWGHLNWLNVLKAMEQYAIIYHREHSEGLQKWMAVEDGLPEEVRKKYWGAIFIDNEWEVFETVYKLFNKIEWCFCNPIDGWRYVFQPTHYMEIAQPTPPKQKEGISN